MILLYTDLLLRALLIGIPSKADEIRRQGLKLAHTSLRAQLILANWFDLNVNSLTGLETAY